MNSDKCHLLAEEIMLDKSATSRKNTKKNQDKMVWAKVPNTKNHPNVNTEAQAISASSWENFSIFIQGLLTS